MRTISVRQAHRWIVVLAGVLVLLLLAGLIILAHVRTHRIMTIVVGPDGAATAAGDTAHPTSLEHAQMLARAHRGQPVRIAMHAGRYQVSSPLSFTGTDSRSKTSPLEIVPFGDGEVTLSGAAHIPAQLFQRGARDNAIMRMPSAVRSRVLRLPLTSVMGKGTIPSPALSGLGLPQAEAAPLLFANSRPQALARYPDHGWLSTTTVRAHGTGLHVTTAALKHLTFAAGEDGMVEGYWGNDYADAALPVSAAPSPGGTLLTATRPEGTVYAPATFYIYNVPEALSVPGEYWIDRQNHMLYWLPPADWRQSGADIALAAGPLVSIQDASYISVSGLTIQGSRGDGVAITNSHDIEASHLDVNNVGGIGITVQRSTSVICAHDHVTATGYGGIRLDGGDRSRLIPARDEAEDNVIDNVGLQQHSYAPAIALSGVGNIAAHNDISDTPHAAIILQGNDHEVSDNHIHHVVLETGDAGAIYMGRDWAGGGNTITDNLIENVGNAKYRGQAGIYLDDFSSGQTVSGNIVHSSDIGVLVGGGDFNIVTGNAFISTRTAIQADARGLSWAASACHPGGIMQNNLAQVPWHTAAWRERFPWLSSIVKYPCLPQGNLISRNHLPMSSTRIDAKFAATTSGAGNATDGNAVLPWSSRQPDGHPLDADTWSRLGLLTPVTPLSQGPR